MEQFIDDHAAEVNNCIILNKAVQHLIPEILSDVRDEIKHLSTIQRELEFDFALSRLPDHLIRKPFLRLVSEVPPLNEDAELRSQRNECNLIDARSSATKKWNKSELEALLSGVAHSACERQITLLTSHREMLLSKIATASKQKRIDTPIHDQAGSRASVKDRAELLAELRSTEDRLELLGSISSTPPRNLITALVSVALDAEKNSIDPRSPEMRRLWERKIFDGFSGPKFIREHHARTLYDLLESADTLLRSSEWDEISVQALRSSISPVNLRLTWHHRLRPGLNHSRWTDEEDAELTKLVSRFGQRGHWEQIAEGLGTNRTAFMCLQRWQTKLNPEFEFQRPWTPAEDTALLDILKRFLEVYAPPLIDWDAVAAYHNTRTALECRSRALAICPAFLKSCFRLPGTILPNMPDRYRDLERAYRYRPFTPNEDLQLLMSIQRHGLAGGRLGSGGGIGVGSWAIVSASLPGRSVRTCQQRYMELCEQFQPWTYSEDRKLYHMRIQLEPCSSTLNLKRVLLLSPFEKLLKYFPGRSVQSLRHRFILLFRWSRTWASLRQIAALQSSGAQAESKSHAKFSDADNNQTMSTPELRQLLLYSPFASQLITQLRESGVTDPEAEALRLFTTWETKRNHTDGGSCSESRTTIDSEFSQLLDDLICGRLVPCPLVTNVPSSNTKLRCPVSDGEVDALDSSTAQLALCPARRLFSHVLLRQFLNKPIREYLATMARHSLVVDTEEKTDTGVDSSGVVARLRPGASARAAAAFTLVQDNNLFSATLDKALLHPNAIRALAAKDKVSSLRKVAPILAKLMVRSFLTHEDEGTAQEQVSVEAVHVSTTDMDKSEPEPNSSDPQPGTDIDASQTENTTEPMADHTADSETTENQTTNPTVLRPVRRSGPYVLAGMKRHKLLEIRRLLLQRGRQWKYEAGAYSIATSSWTGSKLSVVDRATRSRRHVPPVLQALPTDIAIQINRNPEAITSECRMAARTCVAHGLDLLRSNLATNSRAQPDASTTKENATTVARILPPNYATIFALKSLLLHLTNLVRCAGSGFADYIRTREILHTLVNSKPSDGSNEAGTTSSNPDIPNSRQATSARILLSPEYIRFIRVGLSLILWPAMLSTLPAQTFVAAGKRKWEQIYAQLPTVSVQNDIPATTALPSLPKMPRLESETSDSDSEYLMSDDDSDEQLPMKGPKRRSKRYATRRKAPTHAIRRATAGQRRFMHRIGFARLLTEHTVTFKLSDTENEDGLTLQFPSAVQILYACGFRPHSLLRVTR